MASSRVPHEVSCTSFSRGTPLLFSAAAVVLERERQADLLGVEPY